jgi:hypothetical protein
MSPTAPSDEAKAYCLSGGAPLISTLMPHQDRPAPVDARPSALGPTPAERIKRADTAKPGPRQQTSDQPPKGASHGLD